MAPESRAAFIWLNSEHWIGYYERTPDALFTLMHELGHIVIDPRLLDSETELPDAVSDRMQDRADRFALDVFAARGWALPSPLRLMTERWRRFATRMGGGVEA